LSCRGRPKSQTQIPAIDLDTAQKIRQIIREIAIDEERAKIKDVEGQGWNWGRRVKPGRTPRRHGEDSARLRQETYLVAKSVFSIADFQDLSKSIVSMIELSIRVMAQQRVQHTNSGLLDCGQVVL
jgi:hypothetical protein